MPIGPGKYDAWCSRVREATGAKGVVLIVLDREEGSGFSCVAELLLQLRLPEILEDVARSIWTDLEGKE